MNVKELRTITGMSQSQFADHFHIPVSTYRKWEIGVQKPADYIIFMIEAILTFEGYRIEISKEDQVVQENEILMQLKRKKDLRQISEKTKPFM